MGIKINDLTAAASIKASDVLPISQDNGSGGRSTLKVNMQQVAAYAASGVSGGITSVGIISDGSLGIVGSPLVANGNIHVSLRSVGLDKISNTGATDGDVIKYNGSTLTWVASAAPVAPASVPAGCIMMWGTSTPPTGWISCNGQSTASYPNLLAIYGATVPDLRGEFVRGWDDGKGTDSGRTIKSWQKGTIFGHDNTSSSGGVVGVIYTGGEVAQSITLSAVGLDDYAITDYPNILLGSIGATEGSSSLPQFNSNAGSSGATRPRNVALMYIIKT